MKGRYKGRNGKLVSSLAEAIRLSGFKDGMTVSLHHHLRNGDFITNMACAVLEELGYRDVTLHSSGVLQGCTPIIRQIKSGTITCIDTTGIGENIGKELAKGIMKNPARMRTHGGFPAAVLSGDVHLDLAIVAASAADCMGNMNGTHGKNAFGSAGYAYLPAMNADRVIVVTDTLTDYPLFPVSIDETYVDYVVAVDSIGDPKGIASGTIRLTKDPVQLKIAKTAMDVIAASGLLKNGMSFQTGAGGPSLAVTSFLKEAMTEKGIKGSFLLGGVSAYAVELLESGLFETILDTQSFDLKAVESIRTNPKHVEISSMRYADPFAKSTCLDSLDIGILGGIEIDEDFNVNATLSSNGHIMGGSGGHGDVADAASLSIIVAPLMRSRLPIVVDKVLCVSTPGDVIDALVTECGVAVNPARCDLKYDLVKAGVKVRDIGELRAMAEDICGKPNKPKFGDRVVADVYHRTNYVLDRVMNLVD